LGRKWDKKFSYHIFYRRKGNVLTNIPYLYKLKTIMKIQKENLNLANFISTLCIDLGLNLAHDYDGIETEEDIDIYTKAVRRKIIEFKKTTK
jgi:hypothetical protein